MTPGGPPWGPLGPAEPTTGAPDAIPDPSRWQLWWSFNHDPYLDLRHRLDSLATSSGTGSRERARRVMRVALWPHIEAILREGGKTDVIRQALLAAGRMGDDDGLQGVVRLLGLTQAHLKMSRPEVQEAAILSLATLGNQQAIRLLRPLLLDNETGRESMDGEGVGTRNRAYAAFALGMLAKDSTSADARRQVVHALMYALGQENTVDLEIQVAAVLGLGLVPLSVCRSEQQSQDPRMLMDGTFHLCGAAPMNYLADIVRRSDLDPWVKGHAAVALARLGAAAGEQPGGLENHLPYYSRRQVAEILFETIEDKQGVEPVVRGCVIGLGVLGQSASDETAQAIFEVLAELVQRRDPLTQRFALIALGEVLGTAADGELDENVWSFLLRELARGKGGRKSWSALALAVAGHRRMSQGRTVGEDVPGALRLSLAGTKRPDEATAYATALAVLRDEDPRTHEALLRRYARLDDEAFRATAAVGLGLLACRDAREPLKKAFGEGEGDLSSILSAALGLRLLGDASVIPPLIERLASSEDAAERMAIIRALVQLDALESLDALVAIMNDKEAELGLRTVATWALGVLADSDTPDWSAVYANDLNYLCMTWTLSSPLGDGYGLLDWR